MKFTSTYIVCSLSCASPLIFYPELSAENNFALEFVAYNDFNPSAGRQRLVSLCSAIPEFLALHGVSLNMAECYLSSIISLDNTWMISAAGALLNFLSKDLNRFDEDPVKAIKCFSFKRYMHLSMETMV